MTRLGAALFLLIAVVVAADCSDKGCGASSSREQGISLLSTRAVLSRKELAVVANTTTPAPSSKRQHLARRAVYVRWGARTCPTGSKLLYEGFMAAEHHGHKGSGFNYLCMHPEGQKPEGWSSGNQNGALLYGVEYENTGALNKNLDKDAACAVCQWSHGGATYVEWGRGDPHKDASSAATCSSPGHEVVYTGLVMSSHHGHYKAENICVDVERAAHAASADGNNNHGRLYVTEMEKGSADEAAYPHNREVGCMLCGIPARGLTSNGDLAYYPKHERSVFTIWGSRTCPSDSRRVYEGFVAGSHYSHRGGGANQLCMTLNAVAPYGFSDGNQDGNLLYGAEYENTGAIDKNANGDAACAVCEYTAPQQEVYIQWGRSKSCSNDHAQVYSGLVMSTSYSQQKSVSLCVDVKREVHRSSSQGNDNGALLYTTELEQGAANEDSYGNNIEVGCSACAAPAGKSVFTRWGSRTCPQGTTRLYEGWMASAAHNHQGGGANTLCMHTSGEQPDGASSGNQNGNLLYGMEYQNTGAADKSNDLDAACAVCELDRWEGVYTQWGRSDSCSSGHQTLYSGYIMANHYSQHKGEYVCVDSERAAHQKSDKGSQNGGLLYTTEMEQGSSDEKQYPHDVEVGCSVCAALPQEKEVPFAAREGNAIHGAWVKVDTLQLGQKVSVSFGYEAASGTTVSDEEAKVSAAARAWDVRACFSSSFNSTSHVGLTGVNMSGLMPEEFRTCGVMEDDEAKEAVAVIAAKAGSWGTGLSDGSEEVFSVPDSPPQDLRGVPPSGSLHLWQWQWHIQEAPVAALGQEKRSYVAKARGHYVLSPHDPEESQAKRPCCYPGQELGVWYPFRCRSAEGLLPHADQAAHCKVGLPGKDRTDGYQVGQWLRSLGLSEKEYNGTVPSRAVDGQSLLELGTIATKVVKDVFGVHARVSDAFRVLASLLQHSSDS